MRKWSVHFYGHLFNQHDNGALSDLCSNASESSYIRLQSVSCYHFCYSLYSQIALYFLIYPHTWVNVGVAPSLLDMGSMWK